MMLLVARLSEMRLDPAGMISRLHEDGMRIVLHVVDPPVNLHGATGVVLFIVQYKVQPLLTTCDDPLPSCSNLIVN